MRTRTPEIASAGGAGQGAVRLLLFATALRVTAPLGYGSGGWYGRKVSFGPASTARMPWFGAWCDAIERYQMRYKITGWSASPLSLVNTHLFGSARSSPGREAAKRTLDGEDRSGIIQGEGKGGRL